MLLSAIAATTALMPTAANAGTPNCPSGHFCAWRNHNFDGARAVWPHRPNQVTNWQNSIYSDGSPPAYNSSSWHNNGPYLPGGRDDVRLHGAPLGGSVLLCIWRGNSVAYNADVNDEPASHSWAVSCT
jgi:hypothetical protein